jgi:hypothetical protein
MPLTVQAEEEAAAGPLPAGWEKIRRGRAVHYRHVASGRQQRHRPHAIDALAAAGPSRRPEEEAAALQTRAGQALLEGDGALALQCLQQAAQLVATTPLIYPPNFSHLRKRQLYLIHSLHLAAHLLPLQ